MYCWRHQKVVSHIRQQKRTIHFQFGNGEEQHRHIGIPGMTNVRSNYLMSYMKINSNWLRSSSMMVRWMSI